MLTFQKLYAGSYYTDSTATCLVPPPGVALSVTVAAVQEAFTSFLDIVFTSWSGRRYKLRIALCNVVFNHIDDGILYIDNIARYRGGESSIVSISLCHLTQATELEWAGLTI
jgi:hypothetical protein